MQNDQITIMPMQPYVVVHSKDYKRITHSELGISHFYEFSTQKENQHPICSVPDGSIDILFHIGKNEVHTYLSGTVLRAKPWEIGEEQTCFGVRFQAGHGVIPKEVSMDMIVNEDLHIDGNLLGDHLPERIALAKTMEERVAIFQKAYLKMAQKNSDTSLKNNIDQYLRNRILNAKGCISIEELAEETGYSPCYIRRIFKQYHGISPKQFSQFVRFQHLLAVLKKEKPRYETLAIDCGYYDEAHMMKDFKCYTGVTIDNYHNLIADKLEMI